MLLILLFLGCTVENYNSHIKIETEYGLDGYDKSGYDKNGFNMYALHVK